MEQQARNVTMKEWGFLAQSRYLLHDRDGKFCPAFREVIKAGNVRTLQLPAHSPNLNAYAERWVRSVKQECTSRLIFFGESSLRRALTQYTEHYHAERNHQGKGNELLFPLPRRPATRRGAATDTVQRAIGWSAEILRASGGLRTSVQMIFFTIRPAPPATPIATAPKAVAPDAGAKA